jgi:hypothetical protein
MNLVPTNGYVKITAPTEVSVQSGTLDCFIVIYFKFNIQTLGHSFRNLYFMHWKWQGNDSGTQQSFASRSIWNPYLGCGHKSY